MDFKWFRLPGLIAAVLAIGACSAPEPFVLRAYEFDRENKFFPDGPRAPVLEKYNHDKGGVQAIVCYAGSGVDVNLIKQLADDECARFNRTAVFTEHSLNYCPLTRPRAALYNCRLTVASVPARPIIAGSGIGEDATGRPKAPTTESSPKFLFSVPGINDRREQK